MTIKELLDLANQGYPDGYLSEYYDSQGQRKDGFGDTLAQFIVAELIETFDPAASSAEQLAEAIRALERAQEALSQVLNALDRAMPEEPVA